MFLVGMMKWWYGTGWRARFVLHRASLRSTADFFSIQLLIRTLFAPFRQISAGQVDGPIGAQLRAFFDKTISRVIGGIVRTITLLIGVVVLLVQLLWTGIIMIVWLIVPVLPVAGIIVAIIGVQLWQ